MTYILFLVSTLYERKTATQSRMEISNCCSNGLPVSSKAGSLDFRQLGFTLDGIYLHITLDLCELVRLGYSFDLLYMSWSKSTGGHLLQQLEIPRLTT